MDVFVPTHCEAVLADGRDDGDDGGPIEHSSYLNVFELVLIKHCTEYCRELAYCSQHRVLELAYLDLIKHKVVRKVAKVR